MLPSQQILSLLLGSSLRSLNEETSDQFLINLSQKGENNNLEKITLYFDRESLELNKWQIYNEFGEKTSLEFTNIIKNISISTDKFVIHYNNTDE